MTRLTHSGQVASDTLFSLCWLTAALFMFSSRHLTCTRQVLGVIRVIGSIRRTILISLTLVSSCFKTPSPLRWAIWRFSRVCQDLILCLLWCKLWFGFCFFYRSRLCRRGWFENAQILFVWRYRQHGISNGVQRRGWVLPSLVSLIHVLLSVFFSCILIPVWCSGGCLQKFWIWDLVPSDCLSVV